jgi:hypothetical protein
MATTHDGAGKTGPRPTGAGTEGRVEPIESRPGDAPTHVSLLTDDYARSVLEALGDGPSRARDLAATCDVSRATVYRRLNRLVDAGFVAESTAIDPDGHHCKRFRLVRTAVTVTVEDGGLAVTARAE